MNIFVGNLSFASTEDEVRQLFAGFGTVETVTIVMDKRGMKSRGFGFVLMPDDEQARAAIAALHKKEFMGRTLTVVTSAPKQKKAHRSDPAQAAPDASRRQRNPRRRFRRGSEQSYTPRESRDRQGAQRSAHSGSAAAKQQKPEPFWKALLKPFRRPGS